MDEGLCECFTIQLSGTKILIIGLSLSNDSVSQLYDLETEDFSPTSNQPLVNRDSQTVTPLPSGDILVTGGFDIHNGNQIQKSAEIYDPATNKFRMADGQMNYPRASHTATLLDNGLVFIAGGQTDSEGNALDSAELYDPSTDSFSLLSSVMATKRKGQTAVKLKDGKVLVMGGSNHGSGFQKSSEIFDPVEATFTASGEMIVNRGAGFSSTLLPDGNVLITGGQVKPNTPNLDSAELYDTEQALFQALPDMNAARSYHFSILFQNSQYVLIGGGYAAYEAGASASLELYDIQNRTFLKVAQTMKFGRGSIQNAAIRNSSGDVLVFGGNPSATLSVYMPEGDIIRSSDLSTYITGGINQFRIWHSSTTLDDGSVLIAGGIREQSASSLDISVDTAELYYPASGRFVFTEGVMGSCRASHTATLLNDETVLIVGGGDPDETAELYIPTSKSFEPPTGQMSENRIGGHAATLLKDGTVLVTGGANDDGNVLDTVEIYNPQTGTFSGTSGSMTTPRTSHTATMLNDGRVLIAGGSPDMEIKNPLDSAELYYPETRTFQKLDSRMSSARTLHKAIAFEDGSVFIAGGRDSQSQVLSSTETFDPVSGKFQNMSPEMSKPRIYHAITMLRDGRVLITGGNSGSNDTNPGFEVFDPSSGRFTAEGYMQLPRFGHGASLLPSGSVIVTGGRHFVSTQELATITAELYNP